MRSALRVTGLAARNVDEAERQSGTARKPRACPSLNITGVLCFLRRAGSAPLDVRRRTAPEREVCHGSAYEIRVRSAKRVQSGSAKQSQLRSAKRIQVEGAETAAEAGGDRPSGSSCDRAMEPVLDGVAGRQERSGRRRPGQRNERVEDRHASTARAGECCRARWLMGEHAG
jgi:hypothetical protein